MLKRKILIVAFLTFSVNISCLDLRTCSHEIFGKYFCHNNPDAINFLFLKEDGSFLHYYQDEQTTLTDTGEWRRSDKNNCVLELSNWKSFNEKGQNFEQFISGLLWIDGQYLDMGPDGQSNTSFLKAK